jgi:hydrogenase maturation protease
MTAAKSSTIVIGIGNIYCRDDGVGIIVAQRLKQHLLSGVAILEESGEGARLLEAWRNAAVAILVDAVHSGAPTGTIHRLNANTAHIPDKFFHHSTHAFGLAEAIELARALHQLPLRTIVYGIEGSNFGAGVGLCGPVEQAAAAVVAWVLSEIEAAGSQT